MCSKSSLNKAQAFNSCGRGSHELRIYEVDVVLSQKACFVWQGSLGLFAGGLLVTKPIFRTLSCNLTRTWFGTLFGYFLGSCCFLTGSYAILLDNKEKWWSQYILRPPESVGEHQRLDQEPFTSLRLGYSEKVSKASVLVVARPGNAGYHDGQDHIMHRWVEWECHVHADPKNPLIPWPMNSSTLSLFFRQILPAVTAKP